MFWIDGHIVMGYNASDGQISQVYDGNNEGLSWFAGITVLNGEIYVSEFDRHVIHKLSWNGSGFDKMKLLDRQIKNLIGDGGGIMRQLLFQLEMNLH